MAKYRRHLIALLGLAGCAVSFCVAAPQSPAPGAGAGAAAKSEAPKTAVSAIWLPGLGGAMRELFVTPGGNVAPQPLIVGSSSRGRELPLEWGAATSLKLVVRAVNPPAGTSPWQSVGEVTLPGGKTSRYLLLLASPAGATSIRGMAVADDVAAFPIGTVRVANLTGGAVMAKVGDAAGNYAAGFSSPIPYAKTAPLGAKDIPSFPLAVATADGVFFNGKIDAWPGSRTLVLVVPNTVAGKEPLVKSIIDRPPPPPAK